MRQTGDWDGGSPLTEKDFKDVLFEKIKTLNIDQVRTEVEPFVKTPENLSIWSREFFLDIVSRIELV